MYIVFSLSLSLSLSLSPYIYKDILLPPSFMCLFFSPPFLFSTNHGDVFLLFDYFFSISTLKFRAIFYLFLHTSFLFCIFSLFYFIWFRKTILGFQYTRNTSLFFFQANRCFLYIYNMYYVDNF